MNTAPVQHRVLPWHDAKRHLWLLGALVPLLACLCMAAFVRSGPGTGMAAGWVLWVIPALLFVVVPLLDWCVGEDPSNPPEDAARALEADPYYQRLVLAVLPLQLLATVAGAWVVASMDLSGSTWLGLLLTLGGVNGFGIVAAHELGHKKTRLAPWWAKAQLALTAYGHFFVEHNRGHHRHVATPADPASSRMGESFWRFLPRTVLGGLRSAWALERERLAKQGQGPFTLSNHNLQTWLLTLLFYGLLTALWGLPALLLLCGQALYAISLLEVVNYLEHYGLLREKEAPGSTRFERCGPQHSWNSNHTVTNLLLYQLQRHSDHHAHPARQYQALRHFDSSPQLPSGYASMLLLAYVPPLWFAVMDPRVLHHYGGDVQRAHLHPAARQRLLRRYGKV